MPLDSFSASRRKPLEQGFAFASFLLRRVSLRLLYRLFFLMSDVPTLERKIFSSLSFMVWVWVCCSSIIERIVGIIFVQACTSFLVGMHVVILSVSEVIYFCSP